MLAALTIASSSSGTTRRVPAQFPTIQSAMQASAASGDTVLVSPGTYHEKIDFLGREIVLRSVGGAEVTTIDAAGLGGSALLLIGVGERARVIGFTIQHGTGTSWFGSASGGGLHIREPTGEGPIISDNVITDNLAGNGGGIWVYHGPSRILRNRIINNTSGWQGGGISCISMGSSIIVQDNEIFGNIDQSLDGSAGGAHISGFQGAIHFEHNLVACNTAATGGGCDIIGSPQGVFVERNTFVLNRGISGVGGCVIGLFSGRIIDFRANVVAFNFQGGGIDCIQAGLPIDLNPVCNDLWGNGPDLIDDDCGPFLGVNNNIREDPLFGPITGCPPGNDTYCVEEGSPLLPENSPVGCGLIGATGLCGAIGIADETTAPSADGNRLSAQPNPFSTRTTLVIDLVAPEEIDVRITNALGRMVIEQSLGIRHAGRHRWVWDGQDAKGQQAPSGVYYAEIRVGGRHQTTRLMIVR